MSTLFSHTHRCHRQFSDPLCTLYICWLLFYTLSRVDMLLFVQTICDIGIIVHRRHSFVTYCEIDVRFFFSFCQTEINLCSTVHSCVPISISPSHSHRISLSFATNSLSGSFSVCYSFVKYVPRSNWPFCVIVPVFFLFLSFTCFNLMIFPLFLFFDLCSVVAFSCSLVHVLSVPPYMNVLRIENAVYLGVLDNNNKKLASLILLLVCISLYYLDLFFCGCVLYSSFPICMYCIPSSLVPRQYFSCVVRLIVFLCSSLQQKSTPRQSYLLSSV